MTTATTSSTRPWGRIVAILTGSYVTILGLFARIDPEVLLLRIVLTATVTALLARFVVDVILPLLRIDP